VNAAEDPQIITALQDLAGCNGAGDLVRMLATLPGCRAAAIFGAAPDASAVQLAAHPAQCFDQADGDVRTQLQNALHSGQGARAALAQGIPAAGQLLLPLSMPEPGVLWLVLAADCGLAAAHMLPLLRTVVEHALNGAQHFYIR
jgi:hypothetical protein